MANTIESFLTEWTAAERIGDTDLLDALLTDDFVGIGPLGFALHKPEWHARYRHGLHYDSFELEEVEVRTYGEVALVTGREVQRGTFFGSSVPEAARATHALYREGDRWRLCGIHSASSPAPLAPRPCRASHEPGKARSEDDDVGD